MSPCRAMMCGLGWGKGGVTLGWIWSFPPALPAPTAPPARFGEMSRNDPSLADPAWVLNLNLSSYRLQRGLAVAS